MCVATTGSSPNRKFVATWSNAQFRADAGAGNVTFSVILSEGTGVIDIVYAGMASTAEQARADGNSATIGLLDSTSSFPVLWSCNTAVSGGLSNKAITFTPSCV